MLEIGSVIDGKYKILNEVGHGGMSVVYLAMNEKANKQWAIKEVRKDGVKNFEVVQQSLIAETEMLKNLSHPNLPSIVDVIEDSEKFLIVMDYIEGNSLKSALEEYGAQAQDDVIEWAKQLCDVLGYLHSRIPAIIYRDLKPANVMLRPDGKVTLIDFGTAREYKEKNLADTTCLGTMGYAAPEQFGGMGQTDARTDIYCLGATLYHLVTGINPSEPPYEIRPIREINPTLSSGLEKIIIKCTQRNPEERYQSAAELMYALEHYNEIDDEFRKKQKLKLATFCTTVALSIVGVVMAVNGRNLIEKDISDDYEKKLKTATTVEDYYNTIIVSPERAEAYNKLIDYLMMDGDLDKNEAEVLKKLDIGIDVVDEDGYSSSIKVLEEMHRLNKDNYNEVCYNIGYAFLNYKEKSENQIYSYAKEWFNKIESDDMYEDAKVYCDIGDCLEQIKILTRATNKPTNRIASEYEKLIDRLESLEKSTRVNDDVDQQVQSWRIINSIINENAYDIIEASSQERVSDILSNVEKNIDAKSKDDNLRKEVKAVLSELKVDVKATMARVSTYKTSGK